MNEINNTFLKFAKRSETLDIDYLVKTFVNVGPLFTILSNKEHEIIYGRRGTGKTHALLNLKSSINDNHEISVYIDLRTIGSNGGIFSDSSISIVERATRLLIDTISFIVTNIVDNVILDETSKYNLSKVSPIADKIWDSISEIKIESEIEKTENTEENSIDSIQKNRKFELSNKGVSYNREKQSGIGNSEIKTIETKIKGISQHRIHFASLFSNLKNLTKEHISIGIDGEKWIFTHRQKTESASKIPILPVTQMIIDKYENHDQCMIQGRLLPILSNQKMNGWILKNLINQLKYLLLKNGFIQI